MRGNRSARNLLVCAGFVFAAASGRAAFGDVTSSWTQQQADAAHTGHVAADFGASDIRSLWTASAASLGQISLFGGLATDGQHVYVSGYIGSGTDQVLALDLLSGAKQWSHSFVPYNNSGISSPSVGVGGVYVHQYGNSTEGDGIASEFPFLVDLNPSNGNVLFATPHNGQWSDGSRPTPSGSQVFAAGGTYGGVDGYDAITGAHLWSSPISGYHDVAPVADAQNAYAYRIFDGSATGTLYAFNRSNGSTAFTIQNPDDSKFGYGYGNQDLSLGSQNDALVIADGTQGTTLVSLDLAGRTVRWHTPISSGAAIAVDQGIVFATDDTQLLLLDEATGQVLKSVPALTPYNMGPGSLLVTDNLIFVQSSGRTYALDRATLNPVWSTLTSGSMSLGNGLLLIDDGNQIEAFAVPEPAATLCTVCAGLGLLTRRRRVRLAHRHNTHPPTEIDPFPALPVVGFRAAGSTVTAAV